MTPSARASGSEDLAPYVRWLFSGFAMTVLLASVVNVIVDPYYVFNLTSVEGFNLGKPTLVNRTGFAKSYMVERARANAVIMGASRVDVGMDPQMPAWPEHLRPVFNFGVPGSSVYRSLRYLQHATAIHRPRLAVVSLDFGLFLDPLEAQPRTYPPTPQDFEKRLAVTYENQPTPLLHIVHAKDLAASLMSTTALIDSVRTIADQRYSSPTALGFSSGAERFGGEVRSKGSYSVMRDVTQNAAARLAAGVYFDRDSNNSFNFRALRDLLAFARKQRIQLILMIPPSHAFEYELWELLGFWDDFELWKRMILGEIELSSRGVDSESISEPTPEVILWDFSGYSKENVETVPPPGDTKHPMHWFWEPFHFTSDLGNQIVRSLMSDNPHAYGKVLSTSELCNQLIRDRAARSRYRENNQEQVAMLHNILGVDFLAEAATSKRDQDPKAAVCDE